MTINNSSFYLEILVLAGLDAGDHGGDVHGRGDQLRGDGVPLDEKDEVLLQHLLLLPAQPDHRGEQDLEHLEQRVEADALGGVDGGVEVLHDEVRVLERHVVGDEVEQEPRGVVVLGVDVGLEGLEHVRLELLVLGPGAAGARQVLGHLEALGVLEDLPGQEVGGAGGRVVADEVAEETLVNALAKRKKY